MANLVPLEEYDSQNPAPARRRTARLVPIEDVGGPPAPAAPVEATAAPAEVPGAGTDQPGVLTRLARAVDTAVRDWIMPGQPVPGSVMDSRVSTGTIKTEPSTAIPPETGMRPIPKPAAISRIEPASPSFIPAASGGALDAVKAAPQIGMETAVQGYQGLKRVAGDVGTSLGVPGAQGLAAAARAASEAAIARQRSATAPFTEITARERGPRDPAVLPGKLADWVSSPENIAAAGQNLPQLAGVAASLLGAPATATLVATMGLPVTGKAYHDYREKGYDGPVALLGALGQAATETVPEVAWVKFARGTKLGDLRGITKMSPEERSNVVKGLISGYTKISASEIGQEEVSTIGNWLVDRALKDPEATLDKLGKDMIDTIRQVAITSPIMAGTAHAGQALRQRLTETPTGRALTLADELRRAVDEAQLVERPTARTEPARARPAPDLIQPGQGTSTVQPAGTVGPQMPPSLAEQVAAAAGPENRYDSAIARHIEQLMGETQTPLPAIEGVDPTFPKRPGFPRIELPAEPAPTAVGVRREGGAEDGVAQSEWLAQKAQEAGYASVDDMVERDPSTFLRLAEQWRNGEIPTLVGVAGPATRGNTAEQSRLLRAIDREPGVGQPTNPRTVFKDKQGELVVGQITRQDWLKRARAMLPGDELKSARNWYTKLHDTLSPIFGERTTNVALAWLLSQQQASPSHGMMNVMRALDRVRGLPGPKAGLNEAALVRALREGDVEGGMGAKLADFIDSEMGSETRRIMGNDPRGGQPAAIDVHAFRDAGFVDQPLQRYIAKRFGEDAAAQIAQDLSQGSEPSYEHGSRFYNEVAKWLNAHNFDGGGWTASQVQAVGWMAMQKAIGTQGETVDDIIGKNTRRVSVGLSTGAGAPRAQAFGKAEAEKIISDLAELTGIKLLRQTHGVGAYMGDTEMSFQLDALTSPESVQDFMDALGYAFQQTSVIAHRAIKSGKQHAIDVISPALKGRENEFFQKMREAAPTDKQGNELAPGFQISDQGIRLLNFGGHWRQSQMVEIKAAMQKAAADLGIDSLETVDYNVELKESTNDWQAQPEGRAYLASLRDRGRLQVASELERRYGPQAGEDRARANGREAGGEGAQPLAVGVQRGQVADEQDLSSPPQPGQKFIVYRVGKPGDLKNSNGGNADAVARHIAAFDDHDSPSAAGIGTHITAYEVTVGAPFGEYAGVRGGQDAGVSAVGRRVRGREVAYTFPASGFSSREIASVPLQDVRKALSKFNGSFDEAGTNNGAAAIRQVLGSAAPADTEEMVRSLIAKAESLHPKFADFVKLIAKESTGVPIVPPVKGFPRAMAKVKSDYGGDATQLKDLLRATVAVSSPEDVARAYGQALKMYANAGMPVVKQLNRYEKQGGGYKDANTVTVLDGMPAEIQFNVPEMLGAKEHGHALYAIADGIHREARDAGRDLTDAEQEIVAAIGARMNSIYGDAARRIEQRLQSMQEYGEGLSPVEIESSLAYERSRGMSLGKAEAARFEAMRKNSSLEIHRAPSTGLGSETGLGSSPSQAMQPLGVSATGTPSTSQNASLDPAMGGMVADRGVGVVDLAPATAEASPYRMGMKTKSPSEIFPRPQRGTSALDAERAGVIAGALNDLYNAGMPDYLTNGIDAWFTYGRAFTHYNAAFFPAQNAVGIRDDVIHPTGELRSFIAHELSHRMDSLGTYDNHTFIAISHFSPRLDFAYLEPKRLSDPGEVFAAGDLMEEVWGAYTGQEGYRIAPAGLREYLNYPLNAIDQMHSDTVKSELFAQMSALYFTKRNLLKRHFPLWHEMLESVYAHSPTASETIQGNALPAARIRLQKALRVEGSALSTEVGGDWSRGFSRAGQYVAVGVGQRQAGGRVGERAASEQGDASGGALDRADDRRGASAGDVTRTPEFRRWFGDSKVVDAEGRPLVMYHGTAVSDIYEFMGNRGVAGHFAFDPKLANAFAEDRHADEQEVIEEQGDIGYGGQVYPVYLRAARIFDVRDPAHRKLAGMPDLGAFDYNDLEDHAEAIEAAGFDSYYDFETGTAHPPTGIAVFRPEQIKSAIGNRGTFDPKNPSIVGVQRNGWNADQPGAWDAFVREWQNNQIDLKKVEAAIERAGGLIHESNRPYLTEELYHGRVSESTKRFEKMELEPLLKRIAESGLSPDDVGRFLWARHAPERNAQMSKINPGGPADLSGMSNADAARTMQSFTPQQRAQLQAIAAQVDAITKRTRQLLVREGLEDQETIDAWERAYKNYVPLYRDMDEMPGTGAGFKVSGPESKRAMGSQRAAVGILAAVAWQRERAIVRAEKAKVGRDLIKLAEEFPNPDFWRVDQPPMKRRINPSTGMVENTIDPLYRQREDVLVVKERDASGKVTERVLAFNPGNERALRLSRAMQKLDVVELGAVTKIVNKVSRFLANLATQWNPVFWATNFVRDVQTAGINLGSTKLSGHEGKVMARIMPAIGGIADAEFRNGNSTYAKWYREYEANGGKTGWMTIFDGLVDRQREIEKMIDKSGRSKVDPRVWGDWTADVISKTNTAIENGTRLAAYAVAREQGMSEREAASIAKNLTVNFNRKGNRSSAANAWFMFLNANVQGNARMLMGLATSRKAQAIVGVMVALGAAMELINRLIGDRDRDEAGNNPYELLADWEKERNWIFMLPGSGKDGKANLFKIPLAYGFNIFPTVGRLAMESVLTASRSKLVTQKRDHMEMAADLAKVLIDAFGPLGQTATALQYISPTVADPFVQVAENKSFTGAPLVPKRERYNQQLPNSELYFNSNSEMAKDLSRWLNEISGGSAIKSGSIDIYPGHIEHVVRTLTGGPGSFAMGMFDWSKNVAERAMGKDVQPIPTSRVPFVGKFYGEVDERAIEQKFYRLKDRADKVVGEMTAAKKAGEIEAADAIESKNAPLVEFAREAAKKSFQRDRKDLATEMRETRDLPLTDRENAKRVIRQQQSQLYLRALEAYNSAAQEEARQ